MPITPVAPRPFSLHPGPRAHGLIGRAAAVTAPLMDPLLGLSTLDRLYAELPGGDFIDRALERLGIMVDVTDTHLRHVPATGAAIVVANHPTGALDGLAVTHALLRRRNDVRLLGNHLLRRVPEMRDRIIAVNPFAAGAGETRRGLRAARAWLAQGGVLVIFPAGEVSSIAAADGRLLDGPWKRGVLSLANRTGAAVVPAFVDATSSRWFRLAGLVHPRLRTVLLPRELLRLRNRSVGVRFGPPIDRATLASLAGDESRLACLRAHTYALEPARQRAAATAVAIAPAVAPDTLEREITKLTPHHELLQAGDYSVFCSPAQVMPAVLDEIGRLREITFRAAGEGTNRAVDLDRFDQTYQHLFVWHRPTRQIAGAYRIGYTDRVCAGSGVSSLYSSTLFSLDARFLTQLGPALELGRSFVREEYQRQSITLLLLWRGIGALIAREPRYRRLFGPVSISAGYSPVTRTLMAKFLSDHVTPGWQQVARPRHSLCSDPHLGALFDGSRMTLDALDAMVRELEGSRGVPVLLRHYWKLGANVMGLTVDPAFNNSLDALMMVDMTAVGPSVLRRYLGPAGAGGFMDYHRVR
jgi:putative hemolysin